VHCGPARDLAFDRSEGSAAMDETDWTGFERTRDACVPPEWLSDDDGEEPAAGYSLLRQIAEEPDSHLIELRPGVWYDPKLRPDRDKLS